MQNGTYSYWSFFHEQKLEIYGQGAGDTCAYVSTICRMCAVVFLGAPIAQIVIQIG